MSTFQWHLLTPGAAASLILVVVCVAAVSVMGLATARWMRHQPAMKHSALCSALFCTLASPLLVAAFHAMGVSVLVVPIAMSQDHKQPFLEPFPTTIQDIDQVAPVSSAATESGSIAVVVTATEPAVENTRHPDNADSIPGPPALLPSIEPNPDLLPVESTLYPSAIERLRQPMGSVFFIWGCGALLLVIRSGVSWIRLRRILKSLSVADGIERATKLARNRLGAAEWPMVMCSKIARVPFVTGWRKPVVVLPEDSLNDLNSEQLADVLVHEVAHVIRRDQIILWLQAVARCLFWPIIPIHFVNRELGRARKKVCDNYVLAGRDAIGYGETLLKMAAASGGGSPLATAMGILHWRGELEVRIQGLISEPRCVKTRPRRSIAAGICTCLLAISGVICGTAFVAAQADTQRDASDVLVDPSEKPGGRLVRGTVMTSTSEMVSNARVLLIGGSQQSPVTLSETTSDENGGFAFENLKDNDALLDNPGALRIWAEHSNFGLGWSDGLYNGIEADFAIKLKRAGTFEGQLVDAMGNPVAGATVETVRLQSARLGIHPSESVSLPKTLAASRVVRTDDDGNYEIVNVPMTGAVVLKVIAKGFGEPKLWCNVGRHITAVLKPAGDLSGQLKWPEEVELSELGDELGQFSFSANTLYTANGVTKQALEATHVVGYRGTVPVTPDGSFNAKSLPAGDYSTSITLLPHVPLLADASMSPVTIEPHKTASVTVLADSATRIFGRVVAFADNIPVPNASVQLFSIVDSSMRWGPKVVTNDNGEYVAHVRPGKFLLKVTEAPVQFVPLDATTGYHSGNTEERMPTIEITEDTEWPDLRLDPATDVVLEVVDVSGSPVPGALISIKTPAGYPAQKEYATQQFTDKDGRFVVHRVAMNDTLPIRVRTAAAISKPDLIVTPGELDGPVRVLLSDECGFRAKCRVRDADGTPLKNATVKLGTHVPYVSKWYSGISTNGGGTTAKTDAEGIATSGPLWPDLSYTVTASAVGYAKAESAQFRGKVGEVVVVPPFRLNETQLPITGVVVDSDGQSLPDVRIVAAGKTWKSAVSLSDDSGRFRLDAVAPDVRYVFADLAGYRLGGARVGSSGAPTKIVLRQNDSPPKTGRALRRPQRANQLARAKELVELAWQIPMDARITSRIAPLEAMVQIDANQALLMSREAGGQFDYVVRCEVAARNIDDDPESSLQLLEQTQNWRGFNTAIALARKSVAATGAGQGDVGRKLLELAGQIAEKEASPHNFLVLAEVWTSLGQKDKARSFIDRAINSSKKTDSLIPAIAVALSSYEHERAIALAAEVEGDYQRLNTMARVALALAKTDFATAVREVELLKGSQGTRVRDRSRLMIALAIVESDLEGAIKLVQRCEESDNRAQALGHLALAVGSLDKPKAWALIDEALAIHRAQDDAFQGWANYGGAGPFAATLAWQAKQIDYPDMESVIWHVRLACRTKGDVTSGQQRLHATISTARILALVDQFAARELLTSVAGEQGQIPRGKSGLSLYDQWLQAWILVDFARGTALLREDLQRLAATKEVNALRYGHGAVIRLLTATPDEQFSMITNDATGLWKLD